MRLPLHFLVGLCLASSLPAAAPWWQVFGSVRQVEYAGGHWDAELTPDQEAVVKQKEFAEWTDYEDAFVHLRYPKHPEIKFEVTKSGSGLTVEGGVCTSVDNSFQQAYVLTVGKATYGVFLLSPAKWLDDGICMCGPMVHHAYTMRDKCLVRYSLLPGGAVKKAQVLGGGIRLMAFEWTHLACPREIYEQLVDGMRVKLAHPHGEARLKEELVKRYGLDGKAGWLHPGQSLEEMAAFMGAPKKREENAVQWEEEYDDYLVGAKVQLVGGKFASMHEDGVSRVSGPLEGTLTWVEENAGEEKERTAVSDPFVDGGDKAEEADTKATAEAPPRPSPEALSAALVKLAPTSHGYHWRTWCDCVVEMAKHRSHRDEGLIKIIIERAGGRACELEALEAYEQPGLQEWVTTSLTKLAASDPGKVDRTDPTTESADWREGDATTLLGWLVEHDQEPAALESARLLLAADKPEWTAAVFEQAEILPPDLGTKLMVQTFRTAIARQDGSLVENAFQALPKVAISDKAAVRAEVEKLPAGKEGSEWHTNRKNALEALSAEPSKSGD